MRAGLLPLFGAAALLAGCATQGPAPDGAAVPVAAAERGAAFAARECSRCHALGQVGDSPRAGAPPFRDIRIRYNEITFQRRMAEIAEGGHFEMPPLTIDAADARDVSAYIESLGPR